MCVFSEMVARAARRQARNGRALRWSWRAVLIPVMAAAVLTASPAMVPSAARAWNFAFGSNMDVSTRRRRQLEVIDLQPAVAHGWELHFSLPGIPYIEPSFAALRPSNVSTHGVCLELDRESWLRLLVSEGACLQFVGMYGCSSTTMAYAFVDGSVEAPLLLPPSQRYWRLLRNGARKHGLDRSYRDYLLSLPRQGQ
eukprot:Skav226368  [mRNA]  locus=scaffold290:99093:100678:+ [translate_table: standard]